MDKTKESGVTFIIVGTLLLLYMLGILTRGFVIIIAALYLIARGIMITGYHKNVIKILGLGDKKINR